MARPVVVTKALTASAVAVIAAAQALAASGNLALVVGATITLDSQRRVSILSAGNDSGISWTVYGTNDAGVSISETVTGGNAVAVATSQDFKTVTRVAGSGATAGTVQVGTNTTGSTPWFVPDVVIEDFNIGFQTVLISGAATYSIEVTQENVKMPISIYQSGYSQALPVPTAYGWPGLSALAGNGNGAVNTPIAGWRLTVTAGTGTVRATALQSGLVNG